MSNIVKLETADLTAIEKSKAAHIQEVFQPMVAMLENFEDKYNRIIKESGSGIDEQLTKKAKRLRLDIAKIRTTAERVRKEEKEEYLRAGKAIDGVNNILKWAVMDREKNLKEIEDHFEIQERKRLEELQRVRADLLRPYVEDADERDLARMDEDVWDAYLSTKKKEYNDRIEAEKEAERQRQERERRAELLQRRKDEVLHLYDFIEWEALNEEMTEKEFQKVKSEGEKKKEAHRKEQEKLQAEAEKAQKAANRERKKREKIEAEKRKAEEQERKRKEQEERERKEAEAAPIRDRMTRWVDSFALPELPGEDNPTASNIREKFKAFKTWAKKEVENTDNFDPK